MKKVPFLFLISFLILLFMNTCVLAAEPTVLFNNTTLTFDAPILVEKGRTLVPLRTILENLGATIDWHEETKTVVARKGDTVIKLTINSALVLKNGAVFNLDVPAKQINGRTLVPLRFVGEAFGAVVNWDEPSNTINITSGEIDDLKEQAYSRHLGKWRGINPEGRSETYVFNKDGTMSLTYNGKTYKMTYKIDYSKNPVWLDFTYGTNEMKLIVKFNSQNEMYYFTYGDATRPAAFSEAGVTLSKIEEPDLGKIDGNSYSNKYFGVKFSIPEGWHVADEATKEKISQIGKNIFAGNDDNKKALIEASSNDTLQLLTLFKYPPGTAVKSNPAFTCVAESLSGLPGIKNGADYLFQVKSLLQSSAGVKYTFEKDIYTEQVGDVSFDVLETGISMPGLSLKQKYYAAVIKGYALSFALVYTTDDELNDLNEILKTVTFN